MNRFFVVLAILAFSTAAHASRKDGWVLGVQAGLGSPLGSVGVEAGWVIADALTLSGGLGLGRGKTPQASTMLRLESSTPGWGVGIGGGLSIGAWQGREDDDGSILFGVFGGTENSWRQDAEWLLFGNYEVNVHYQSQGGSKVRFVLGSQRSLAGEITCSPMSGTEACADERHGAPDFVQWPYIALNTEF